MYAVFDRNSPSSLTDNVLSLSWKGDARQGWLASGNSRKTVGVTYTEMRDEEEVDCDMFDLPDVSLERQGMRRNFNFREHTDEVCSPTIVCVCSECVVCRGRVRTCFLRNVFVLCLDSYRDQAM